MVEERGGLGGTEDARVAATMKGDGGRGAQMEIVDGAKMAGALATLPADRPSGTFQHLGETLPW